jgi:hypothetical protein
MAGESEQLHPGNVLDDLLPRPGTKSTICKRKQEVLSGFGLTWSLLRGNLWLLSSATKRSCLDSCLQAQRRRSPHAASSLLRRSGLAQSHAETILMSQGLRVTSIRPVLGSGRAEMPTKQSLRSRHHEDVRTNPQERRCALAPAAHPRLICRLVWLSYCPAA